MKKVIITLVFVGIFIYEFPTLSAFNSHDRSPVVFEEATACHPPNAKKKEAYQILKTKCNVCHRKQNPFKIFRLKNMSKYAPKIFQQVFIEKRMPKGDKIKLSKEESETLKKWLRQEGFIIAI